MLKTTGSPKESTAKALEVDGSKIVGFGVGGGADGSNKKVENYFDPISSKSNFVF